MAFIAAAIKTARRVFSKLRPVRASKLSRTEAAPLAGQAAASDRLTALLTTAIKDNLDLLERLDAAKQENTKLAVQLRVTEGRLRQWEDEHTWTRTIPEEVIAAKDREFVGRGASATERASAPTQGLVKPHLVFSTSCTEVGYLSLGCVDGAVPAIIFTLPTFPTLPALDDALESIDPALLSVPRRPRRCLSSTSTPTTPCRRRRRLPRPHAHPGPVVTPARCSLPSTPKEALRPSVRLAALKRRSLPPPPAFKPLKSGSPRDPMFRWSR
ncbi:uncharacterized protein BXZ73DRAFT_102692 [Epithele typhae]|uniref:uncharacterized protein n=1 Tax=Epithele typhae TaxID=378194 RepID=UPI0020083B86|nr:uncharacterized protein BXZ73DRAFT_102692 [Epithele typhae]KAH9927101.1 hypothetical protein BXZ73DRAFT_102692 [Epithele typhae]